MIINKENIEEYIFNYLEGNLSSKELEKFKTYVNSNPEAKMELADWKQAYVISKTPVGTADFSSLKKDNSIYYWAVGIGAAFLLSIGIYIGNSHTIKITEPTMKTLPKFMPSINVDKPSNKIIEKEEKRITTSEESFKIKVNSTTENEIIQLREIENIDLVETLQIDVEKIEGSREGKFKKIKLKKKIKSTKNNKVDVIDMEHGF